MKSNKKTILPLQDSISMSHVGKVVFVYFNLHKKCWSVRYKGRVIAHVNNLFLCDVTFKVSQAGRLRVIREKRKNVHAGVVGTLIIHLGSSVRAETPVTYNPYLYETFVIKSSRSPLYGSGAVKMSVANFVPTVLVSLAENST
jgi:hypothetical protein